MKNILLCLFCLVISGGPAGARTIHVPEGPKTEHVLFPEDNVKISLPSGYAVKRVRGKYFSIKTGQTKGLAFLDISKEAELYDYSYKDGIETKLNGKTIYYLIKTPKSLSGCPQSVSMDLWFPFKGVSSIVIRSAGCFESLGMADLSLVWYIADQIMKQE